MTDEPLTIVALGDSLTEGFGVAPYDAYPFVLQGLLKADGIACRMINAGVSGDTCRALLARLAALAGWAPDLVILEIGLNDVLMGRMAQRIRADLGTIIAQLATFNTAVAVAGLQMPPLGDAESEAEFAALYPEVARTHGAALIPGFTAPLWQAPGRVQYDGLHPNAAGYRAICAHILPDVKRTIIQLLLAEKTSGSRRL